MTKRTLIGVTVLTFAGVAVALAAPDPDVDLLTGATRLEDPDTDVHTDTDQRLFYDTDGALVLGGIAGRLGTSAPQNQWQRDRWIDDSATERYVHFVYENAFSLTAAAGSGTAAGYVDMCAKSPGPGVASTGDPSGIVTFAGQKFRTILSTATVTTYGGLPNDTFTATTSVPPSSGASDDVVSVPEAFKDALALEFVTLGARSGNGSYDVIFQYEYVGAGGGSLPPPGTLFEYTVAVPVSDIDVNSTSGTPRTGIGPTTVPVTPSATGPGDQDFDVTTVAFDATLETGSGPDSIDADCGAGTAGADVVSIDLPAAPADYELVGYRFAYTARVSGSTNNFLGGPIASRLVLTPADYDAAFHYRSVAITGDDPGTSTVLEAIDGDEAWWFALDYDVDAFPDTTSDVFLYGACGDDDGGGGVTFGAEFEITPNGLRTDGGGLSLGTINFPTADVCRSQFFRVRAEVVAAYDEAPRIEALTVSYDRDDDNDCYTTGGVYLPTVAQNPACAGILAPAEDCDDDSAVVNPGRPTDAAGSTLDANCDGFITCYFDGDGDGDGVSTTTPRSVASPGATGTCVPTMAGQSFSANADDCLDSDDDYTRNNLFSTRNTLSPEVNNDYDCSGTTGCYTDSDDDGFGIGGVQTGITIVVGSGSTVTNVCGRITSADYASVATDCLDSDATVKPGGGQALLDTTDRDCNGFISCYADLDEDGDGSSTVLTNVPVTTPGATGTCVGNSGSVYFSDNDDDCRDQSGPNKAVSATFNANNRNGLQAAETTGDPNDYDCDGGVACFTDADADGVGVNTPVFLSVGTGNFQLASCTRSDSATFTFNPVTNLPTTTLAGPTAGVTASFDCNDASTQYFPGSTVTEATGAGDDFNCDGNVTCFLDADGDTYGSDTAPPQTVSLAGSAFQIDCDTVANRASRDGDCKDSLPAVNDGGTEVLGDPQDKNCDGDIRCYRDDDGDGDGVNSGVTVLLSAQGLGAGDTGTCAGAADAGYADNAVDCRDTATNASLRAESKQYNVNDRFSTRGIETTGLGADFDCSGTVLCFVDGDGDAFGSATQTRTPGGTGFSGACSVTGFSTVGGDCNDGSNLYYPEDNGPNPNEDAASFAGVGIDYDCDSDVWCYVDADGDSFAGTSTAILPTGSAGATLSCNRSAVQNTGVGVVPDGVQTRGTTTDCNDTVGVGTAYRPDITDAAERGEAFDFNCDGEVVCYADADADGDGNPSLGTLVTFSVGAGGQLTAGTCDIRTPVSGTPTSSNADDCRDNDDDYNTNNAFSTRATENPADATDYDCDSRVFCHLDFDGDGFGIDAFRNAAGVGFQPGADLPGGCDISPAGGNPGYSSVGGDCLDCRSLTPASCSGGGSADAEPFCATHVPATCADTAAQLSENFRANPAGTEVPGLSFLVSVAGVDIDEDCSADVACFPDADNDGFGSEAVGVNPSIDYDGAVSAGNGWRFTSPKPSADGFGDCAAEPFASSLRTDCHDTQPTIFPGNGLAEVPGNTFDDDCSGNALCLQDLDGDGVAGALNWQASNVTLTSFQGTSAWVGTRQTDPDNVGASVARALGAPYVCLASNQQASIAPAGTLYDCFDESTVNPATGFPYGREVAPGLADTNGTGIDNNCDGIVQCFVDADGDSFGGATQPYDTSLGYVSPADGVTPLTVFGHYPGFSHDDAPAVTFGTPCTIANGFTDNGDDCHDNYALANPSRPAEIPGNQVVTLANGTTGEYAFDDNCSGQYDCYQDYDGDGYGTVVVSDPRPAGSAATLTMDCRIPGAALPEDRRASIGGGTPGALGSNFDCHDDPTTAGAASNPGAPAEIPGDGYDNNCDGTVDCYEDLDNDEFGTQTLAFVTVNWAAIAASSFGAPSSNPATPSAAWVPASGSASAWGTFSCAAPSNYAATRTIGADTRFDCHDTNAEAFPASPNSKTGNSNVSGLTTFAYDENCDGTVRCYRNVDGDQYGTFEVALTVSTTTTSDAARTIAKVTGQDYFLCDDVGNDWAGAGGVNSDDFDCHDDNAAAYPTGAATRYNLSVTEVAGDAFDNNCDGNVNCYEDLDNDTYGTAVVTVAASSFPLLASPQYDAGTGFSADDAGMALFVCGRESATGAGVTLSQAQVTALGLDSDGYAARGGSVGQSTFDCHDNNPLANPGIAAETPGHITDPFSGLSLAFDENCDGSFTCYTDRDNDAFGTTTKSVGRTWVATTRLGAFGITTGVSAHDVGVFSCDLAPPGAGTSAAFAEYDEPGVSTETHLSAVGGGSWGDASFDCHDNNANAFPSNPAGEDPGDSTAVDAVGVTTTSFSYDDDCDGVVACFRDYDGDGFGTYVRTLSRATGTATSSDADGRIALISGQTYFDCDQAGQPWAGIGGTDPNSFDCHDDPTAAGAASNPDAAGEISGDAYDNDCDGLVSCFEDRDNDSYGTIVVPVATTPSTGILAPSFDATADVSGASSGLLVFPCGTNSATSAGLDPSNPTIAAALASDRRAERGGTGTAQYDCHDDWPEANPGVALETSGDPWDNNCDGVVSCWQDRDGDGFGSRTAFDVATAPILAAGVSGVSVGQTFDSFPWAVPYGVLPGFPLSAYPTLNTFLSAAGQVERNARRGADQDMWFVCTRIAEGAAIGGTASGLDDCHDNDATTHPGFQLDGNGQVDIILPNERRAVGSPNATCDGPIMCVRGSGAGLQITPTSNDQCLAEGGTWRCFESTSGTDNGEVAGDTLDNDCDGQVMCYENRDNDLVGTIAVLDSGNDATPSTFDDGAYACDAVGESPYTGDCHDDDSSIQPALPASAELGDDLTTFIDYSDTDMFPPADWDDPIGSCPAGFVVCRDPISGSVFDKFDRTTCPATWQVFCVETETVGDDLDQDCDGLVGCFFDGDGDGFGSAATDVRLASTARADRIPQIGSNDPGRFQCSNPAEFLAPTQLVDGVRTFDCNDANRFENPNGVEPVDLASYFLLPPGERQRGFDAVGNGIDENCDGTIACFADLDDDGFGGGVLPTGFSVVTSSLGDYQPWNGTAPVLFGIIPSIDGTCTFPFAAPSIGDCYDLRFDANPGVVEVPGNDFDDNCDGTWVCYVDSDGDGFGRDTTINDVNGDRTCTTDQGEADDNVDCLDLNSRTGIAGGSGVRYPILPDGTLDGDLPFAQWTSAARLTYPGGIELYGDGIDGDCDGAELCFVDQDDDRFVDGEGALGSDGSPITDRLGRFGNVLPKLGDDSGLILCVDTTIDDEGNEINISPWPLGTGAVVGGEDPYLDPTSGLAYFDCDDSNDAIKPAANSELFYNGLDEDCDNRSDFDRDLDGYDSFARVAEFRDGGGNRPECPDFFSAAAQGQRVTFDHIVGCGAGQDVNDAPGGGERIHPAPYLPNADRDGDGVPNEEEALTASSRSCINPPASGIVERFPEFDPITAPTPDYCGIKGDPEVCETPVAQAIQIDSDSDGNANTTRECFFDIWAYDDDLADWQLNQQAKQRPWGLLPKARYTRCIQPFGSGLYNRDRLETLDYTPTQLADPVVYLEAQSRYTDFIYDATYVAPLPIAALPGSVPGPTKFYPDADGDGFGALNIQGTYLCTTQNEPVTWTTKAQDCDDTRATIRPGGDEICDGIDNNCNNIADEQSLALTPEIDPACEWHYIDNDADQYGLREEDVVEGTTDRYCLCPLFQELERQPNGSFVRVEPPQVCFYYPEGADVAIAGHSIGGSCYVPNSDDCDDLNPLIKPFDPAEDRFELIDGVDNDCNGELPLIEVDCDEDNAYPFLPLMTAELLANPDTTPILSAEAVGLAPCEGAPPKVECFEGEPLPLKCDTETGLWVVQTQALIELEKFDGAARTARSNNRCESWDCDDQCASRCAGASETCDGLDNDCNGFAAEVVLPFPSDPEEPDGRVLMPRDLDGVPDPVKPADGAFALGFVDPSELDLDLDNFATCDANFSGSDNQTAVTVAECSQIENFDDCNDLCVLSSPAAEADQCNGFVASNTCANGAPSDRDGDFHVSCGTFGEVREATEKIYALMFTQGDIAAFAGGDGSAIERVVPIIPPRREGDPDCREGDEGCTPPGDFRACDEPLVTALEDLVGPLPTEPDAARKRLLEVCVLADTCAQLQATIDASRGDADINDGSEGAIPRPGGQSPATPDVFIPELPDYCAPLEGARCSIVELELDHERDADLYDVTAWPARGCVFEDDGTTLFRPMEAITRAVWDQHQIVQARKLVVEYECYRMFGTFGCDTDATSADLYLAGTWDSPYDPAQPRETGFFRLPEVPVEVYESDARWWLWVNRYLPVTRAGDGTLVGCWGDPRGDAAAIDQAETIDLVGGDCTPQVVEGAEDVSPDAASRGAYEGPGDLLAIYRDEIVSCATCTDGVDNNCNGLLDADEPACARCFVGQGAGCGCSAAAGSGSVGRTSAPVLLVWGLLVALARRRRDRP